MAQNLIITLLFIKISVIAVAQTTWTGAVDTDWHKACNWNTNAIPTCTDNVVIPSVTNKPTVSATACFNNLEVQTGANITVQSPSFLIQNCPCTPTVNSAPTPAQPSVITGTTPVCQSNNGVAYSVTNVAGVTYTWSYSGTGYTQASGGTTNSITANFSASATSGTLTITPSNVCGSGTARTFAVTVNSVPAQPSAITGTSSVCQSQSGVDYSVTNVAGVTYTWTYSGTGFTCATGCATNAITANFSASATSGTLTVTPSNACGSGTAQTFAITVNTLPAQPSAITGTSLVCQSQNGVGYSVTNVAGVTYTWSYSGTGYTQASGGTTNSITANFSASATSGTLTITPSNVCGSGTARSFAVTVNSVPAQPSAITGTSPVCQSQSGVGYSVTNVAGVTYTWTYSGTGFTCATGCATNSITANFSASATSGTLTVTPSNACGSGTAQTFAITVNTLPAQPSAITGASLVCQSQSGVGYSVTNVAGVTYTWTYSGTGFTCATGCATNSITANFSSTATSGTLTVTPSNACGSGTARTFAVTVGSAVINTISWSGGVYDTGSLSDFSQGTKSFATLNNVTQLTLTTPNGYGHAGGHATTTTYSIELFNPSTSVWVTVWTLTSASDFAMNGINVTFGSISQVNQMRINSSPFLNQTYHSFAGTDSFTLRGCP